MHIRPAQAADIDQLCAIEQSCFNTDRISRRSFSRFIKRDNHSALLVAVADQGQIAGYGLNLYRENISLARLYSIACAPDYRGQSVGELLIQALEADAIERACAYWRLEVREDATKVAAWYQALGFKQRGLSPGYYEDGCSALKMEKRLLPAVASRPSSLYYAQTTPFTCGPSALLMAMAQASGDVSASQTAELDIWREATTIYMTQGVGGCSGEGLALAASKRGFEGELWVSDNDTPFVDSVRDAAKKQIIETVHEHFLSQLSASPVTRKVGQRNIEQLREKLENGYSLIALISTWTLNRNRAPHWVHIVAISEKFVYINDPDLDAEDWQQSAVSAADFSSLPMTHAAFERARSYGKRRLSVVLCIKSAVVSQS